jgi:hypothetical protein
MVYGSEAVLPVDLIFGAPKLTFESIAEAEATRLEDIDVLEEEWLNVVIQSARYQQTLRRYHDKAVRHRSFVVGDLVLRRVVTETPKVLGPPTDVLVLRTSDNHVDARNHSTSSVVCIIIISPKSASPITQTLHT